MDFVIARMNGFGFTLTMLLNRVNEEAIQKYVGEKIIKADADLTRMVTGFAIGGIPPLGHKTSISHVYIDEDLLQKDQNYIKRYTAHKQSNNNVILKSFQNLVIYRLKSW